MIYLLLATSMATCATFSLYATTNTYAAEARTATFDFDLVIDNKFVTDFGVAAFDLTPASIYATAKLSEAADCDFDEVAIVREITVTNKSETAVRVEIEMAAMGDTGVVWCILDGKKNDILDAYGNYYEAITAKLKNGIPLDFSTLKTALKNANDKTVTEWNASGLGFDAEYNTKTVTVVFWAEHDQVMDYYETASPGQINAPVDLYLSVAQIN